MSETTAGRRKVRATRSGLADQVVEHLLQDSTEGVYPPGSQLPPEPVLAEEAGVSRLTLREAVKALQQRGVVRVEQGRGTFVNESSQWLAFDPTLLAGLVRRDHALAVELTEVRKIVEVGAAGLAAQRRKAGALEEMRDALERMSAAREADDVAALSQADIDFHLAVLNAAGNHFVPALLAPIDSALRALRLQTSQDLRMSDRAIVMHGRIYEAIRKRSSKLAADLMSRHLDETRKHIAELGNERANGTA